MYKVLLVDDEALIREAISENTRWKELGYELMGTCKNGREAIERLDQEEADLVPDRYLHALCGRHGTDPLSL